MPLEEAQCVTAENPDPHVMPHSRKASVCVCHDGSPATDFALSWAIKNVLE